MNTATDTIRFSQIDWDDDDAVLAFVDQTITDRPDYHQAIDRQTKVNRAWYAGQQHLLPNHVGELVMHPNPQNRVRLVDNRILPHVETILSWLGSTPVELETVAGADSADERDKSRLRTKVLEYYTSYLGLEEIVDESDHWAVTSGNAFIKVTWDPDLGSEMDMDADFAFKAATEAGLRDRIRDFLA